MPKYSADFIYPVSSKPIPNGVVITDQNGKIEAVLESSDGLENVQHHDGIICPGFINTHCHLELSHMKGVVSEGNGLVEFIKELMSQRDADPNFIQESISLADQEMIDNGIVAVGDISNGTDSFQQKTKSSIHYHTFIELYGFMDEQAEESFSAGMLLIEKYREQLQNYSLVPHSPYSTSPKLWDKIYKWNQNNNGIISFHNEETQDENLLFTNGTGSLIDLMQWFGLDTSFWKPTKKTSLQSVQDLLPAASNLILVHNTYTTRPEISEMNQTFGNCFWCLCPNANWYIERTLPNINNFETSKITLGTDSLSSNWKLSILSEMQKIQQHYPNISTEKLIQWGTLNGAKALNVDRSMGSLTEGKTPGINLISNCLNGEISSSSDITKLI